MLADFLPFPHDKGHDLFSKKREPTFFPSCLVHTCVSTSASNKERNG